MKLSEKLDVLQTKLRLFKAEAEQREVDLQTKVSNLEFQAKADKELQYRTQSESWDKDKTIRTLIEERDIARGVVKAFMELKIEVPVKLP